MNIQENALPLRGDLRVTVRDATSGEVQRQLQIRNTITYGALKAIIKLLAQTTGTTLTAFKVASLRVGTGTAAPVRENTALGHEIVSLPLSDTPSQNKYLSVEGTPYELKLVVTLESGQANGEALTEAGLFLSDGTLIARQVYPAIPKSSAIVIDYDWRIEFTA